MIRHMVMFRWIPEATREQKEQVKAFTESGHQMEAQKIVLDELQKRYGGLADKIGNTTAGKVAELTHAFDDLFAIGYSLVVAVGSDLPTLRSSYLDRALLDPQHPRRADILAHLGWATFLKRRETGTGDPAALYKQALTIGQTYGLAINPSRDGRKAGLINTLTFPDGRMFRLGTGIEEQQR